MRLEWRKLPIKVRDGQAEYGIESKAGLLRKRTTGEKKGLLVSETC